MAEQPTATVKETRALHCSILEDLLNILQNNYSFALWKDLPLCLIISQQIVVSIWPDPPVTMEVGIQADMFLVASLPEQPSTLTLVAAAT